MPIKEVSYEEAIELVEFLPADFAESPGKIPWHISAISKCEGNVLLFPLCMHPIPL